MANQDMAVDYPKQGDPAVAKDVDATPSEADVPADE